MDIHHNFILLHLGNSDFGFELLKELYNLQNQLIIVGKDSEYLDFLQGQFPKIDTINCDPQKKTDVDSLVLKCQNIYPFLDIIIHHNFCKDILQKADFALEYEKCLAESENISVRLLPIISNKVNSAIIYPNLDYSKVHPKQHPVQHHPAHSLLILKEKLVKTKAKLYVFALPLFFVHFENEKIRHHAVNAINRIINDFERDIYLKSDKKDNFFRKWLKKLIPRYNTN